MTTVDYVIIGLYLLLMLGLGAFIVGRIHGFKDYFLAGGQLTTPLLVCTLVSTYYELDVTISTSEVSYYDGVVAWFWYSRPFYLTIFIAAFLLARRLKKHDFMTLPDVLGYTYGNTSRVAGALACFVYSMPIAMFAGLMAMFQVLHWPVTTSLVVSVAVCAIYTSMGGLWADAITDTIQFVLMCVSLAIAIPIALKLVGGFGFTHALPPEHLKSTGGVSPWLLSAYAITALTVFVDPSFYQRIFAAKDSKQVTRAMLIGIGLWAAYDWGVTFIGLIARAAVDQGLLPAGLEGRQALLTVCLQTLPIGLRGFFIGGVIAAAMSSVDSYSLLASGNLVYDIWRPLSRRKLSDRTLLRATRIGVVVVMVTGAVVSLAFARIADAWLFAASVLTSVVFVPVMGALFWKPKRLAGMAGTVGGVAALLAFYLFIYTQGTYDPDEESYVFVVNGVQIWREYAIVFALPVSTIAFFIGHALGRSYAARDVA